MQEDTHEETEPINPPNIEESRNFFKCSQKGQDMLKGLGHILSCKKKTKLKSQDWPPGDIKPGQAEGYGKSYNISIKISFNMVLM